MPDNEISPFHRLCHDLWSLQNATWIKRILIAFSHGWLPNSIYTRCRDDFCNVFWNDREFGCSIQTLVIRSKLVFIASISLFALYFT